MPNPAILTGDFSAETYTAAVGFRLARRPAAGLRNSGLHEASRLGGNCMPVEPAHRTAVPGKHSSRTPLQTAASGWSRFQNSFWQTPTIANQPEGVVNYIKNFGFPCTRTSRPIVEIRILASSVRSSSATPMPITPTRGRTTPGSCPRLRDLSSESDELAVSHTINFGGSNVNNFRFGHLYANAPQGGAEIPPTRCRALGLTGIFTKFTALQQTWPNVGLTGSAAAADRSTPTADPTARLGVCRLVHFDSRQAHYWSRRSTIGA